MIQKDAAAYIFDTCRSPFSFLLLVETHVYVHDNRHTLLLFAVAPSYHAILYGERRLLAPQYYSRHLVLRLGTTSNAPHQSPRGRQSRNYYTLEEEDFHLDYSDIKPRKSRPGPPFSNVSADCYGFPMVRFCTGKYW